MGDLREKAIELIEEAEEHQKIDLLALHLEFQKQSVLYLRYANIQADLIKERQEHAAFLNQKIRDEYIDEKGKAPSESYIERVLTLNSKYISYTAKIQKFEGILKALEHKRKSLEKLSDLAIAGYFSTPIERNR